MAMAPVDFLVAWNGAGLDGRPGEKDGSPLEG